MGKGVGGKNGRGREEERSNWERIRPSVNFSIPNVYIKILGMIIICIIIIPSILMYTLGIEEFTCLQV